MKNIYQNINAKFKNFSRIIVEISKRKLLK